MESKKKAIIVGASSGIGEQCAIKLLGGGYSVVNISRTSTSLTLHNICADASIPGSLKRAARQAVHILNRGQGIYETSEIEPNVLQPMSLDVLIYSAGFSLASPIEYAVEDDYRYLFDVNYFGAIECLQACIPYMKSKGGRIILISSLGASIPIAFDAFYSSSKAALDMLAFGAGLELEPYNITVTSLKPGGVATDFTFKRKVYADEKIGEYALKQHGAVESLAQIEQGGMKAEEIANRVMSIINSHKPPLQTSAGIKNNTYLTASKLLPTRIVQYLAASKYDL